jgi:predicted AlkP superfamily pyrophosphatase or phosphodiesterase
MDVLDEKPSMRTYRCKTFLFVFSLFILLACQIPTASGVAFLLPTPTSAATQPPILTPTASQMPTATLTQAPTLTATISLTATPTDTPSPTITPTFAPPARRVVIVSIDGLRPDAIFPASMSNLITLMQSGAFSLGAQTVFPSVTLVAHASMLTGLCPSKHGLLWNEYLPERGYAPGTDLFDLAHAAGLKTIMYIGSDKMRQIVEPASIDRFIYIEDRDSVIMGSLVAHFPQDFGLLFVHLVATDIAGHAAGWMSQYQLNTIHLADDALGMLLAELDARNLRGETLIIVTSDHGGSGGGHGTDIREDMTIPWVASGPGIQPKTLTTIVHTTDTAATAAFALGLPIPADWDGVPIYEAFGLPVERQSLQCQE